MRNLRPVRMAGTVRLQFRQGNKGPAMVEEASQIFNRSRRKKRNAGRIMSILAKNIVLGIWAFGMLSVLVFLFRAWIYNKAKRQNAKERRIYEDFYDDLFL